MQRYKLEKLSISLPDLVRWTTSFHSLIRAGLPILSCLQVLANSEFLQNASVKKITYSLMESINNGLPLAYAMRGAQMPEIVVRLMKIAEETGELEYCMKLLAQQFQERLEWNRKWHSILTYPILLLSTSFVLLFSISLFVLPQFTNLYEMMGVPISGITRTVLISVHYGIPALMGLFLIIMGVGLICWKQIKQDREKCYKLVLKVIHLRKVGPLVRLWLSTRFSESCVILLQAGIPILEALIILSELDQHPLISTLANKMLDKLLEGAAIQQISSGLPFTNDFQVMLQTADRTGDLAECMNLSQQIMQREWKFQLEFLTQKIQPMLIFILGTVVCGVVLAVMLPLYDVMAKL